MAVMVGGFPRKAGMERKDVMSKNVSIYKAQASALEKHAAKGVKVGCSKPGCGNCTGYLPKWNVTVVLLGSHVGNPKSTGC